MGVYTGPKNMIFQVARAIEDCPEGVELLDFDIDRARRAIAALRNPDRKSILVGCDLLAKKKGWRNEELILANWQAIIDAMLEG